MDIPELTRLCHDAVLRCLARCLLPQTSESHLACDDHAGINQEFEFLSPLRNAKTNTFLTKQNTSLNYNSLFVGGSKKVQQTQSRISNVVSTYLVDVSGQIERSSKAIQESDGHIVLLQSPLAIVSDLLTDHSAIETKDVARFFIKLKLMDDFSTNINLQGNLPHPVDNEVTFDALDKFYTTLEKYIHGRDNRDPKNNVQRYLAHLFAANGLLLIRIVLTGETLTALQERPIEQVGALLNDHINSESEFRISTKFTKLPSIAELANIVFGVPIAIAGFNQLLGGGLRQGVGEGTVTLLRGGAGSGKTTLSISMQRAFEALGIPTIFLSSEESFEAIRARRKSVLNLSQKSHSRYTEDEKLFEIVDVQISKSDQRVSGRGIFDLVSALADALQSREVSNQKVAQFARMFLVIDGIHNFIDSDEKGDIKRLIDTCRATNSHVLITGSEEWAEKEGIEYFVDNFFSLNTRTLLEPMPHVSRGISILKTRHQSSLIGDHFMTFRDEGDLAFTPNFSALLKMHSRYEVQLADKQVYSKPFLLGLPSGAASNTMLQLEHHERSLTLLYGRGSASKTSLSFRLLASPNVAGKNSAKKLLVVSFLSPNKYYQDKKRSFLRWLEGALRDQIAFEKSTVKRDIYKDTISEHYPHWNELDVETISYTPGMISPEEVYSEVAAKIDSNNEGASSYTGVLFDGLHNIFVQFPRLERHPELWSALINLVRRVGLKTVVTFTDFEVWGARTLTTVDYESTRSKPLLVALSQSIDFGFGLVPVNQVGDDGQRLKQGQLFEEDNPGRFVLSSFMAHSQASPTDFLIWDRSTESTSLPPK